MFEQEYYKNMLDSLPCGICKVALDEELTIIYANRSYYEIYGYTIDNAKEIGFINAKFILPKQDYHLIFKKVMQHVSNCDKEFQLEYQGVHSTGKTMWLLVRCSYDVNQPDSILCVLVDIAERKQMEEDLKISIEENKIAYSLTDKLMYIYDIEEKVLYQPILAADEFGLPAIVKNAPYSIVNTGAIDAGSVEVYISFYESIIQGESSGHAVVKKRRKDGSFGWYEAKFSTIYNSQGKAKKAIISCEDITKQREKEFNYQKWSEYFKAHEGQIIGFYEYNLTKDTFERDAGDIPPDYLKSLNTYTETVKYIAEHFVSHQYKEKFYQFFDRDSLIERFYEGQTRGALEYLRLNNQGRLYWVRAITLLLADPYSGDICLFMMSLNIDNEKREQLKIKKQIEHDAMTGLLNRETFIKKVADYIDLEGPSKYHALIILDIDEFKKYNDLYGHPFGDQVIKDTAYFMKNFLRDSDICGRIGGDEFMIFLKDIKSEDDVRPRFEKLIQLLRRAYVDKVEVTCSMGVAIYPTHGTDFSTLYKNADLALYDAKHAGRGRYKVYLLKDKK